MSREITSMLLELAEDGMVSWEAIARGCLNVMSEDDVADMANAEGLLEDEEDDDFEFGDSNTEFDNMFGGDRDRLNNLSIRK